MDDAQYLRREYFVKIDFDLYERKLLDPRQNDLQKVFPEFRFSNIRKYCYLVLQLERNLNS